MTACERAEESLRTAFHANIWEPFMDAIRLYELIQPGDHIAACISGGKDSMLMAKLLQLYQQEAAIPFELTFLIMDPGYNELNRAKVESNARLLELPYTLFESDIFAVANAQEKNPCFLCAKMRRGTLYAKAQELGCNKIALGHHFSDVVETTLMAMCYGAQLQAMPPKLNATNFPGMQLIRPLYLVHEDAIIAWKQANELTFIQCACRFTEHCAVCDNGGGGSKRQETKQLLRRLRREHPEVERNTMRSIHRLDLTAMPGWKAHGEEHTITERFPVPSAATLSAD